MDSAAVEADPDKFGILLGILSWIMKNIGPFFRENPLQNREFGGIISALNGRM